MTCLEGCGKDNRSGKSIEYCKHFVEIIAKDEAESSKKCLLFIYFPGAIVDKIY